METKVNKFSVITDQDSLVHKIMTYGVAVAIIALCIFLTPGGEALNPATGWLIVVFLLYYALLSKRILETIIFGCAIGVALFYGKDFLGGLTETTFSTMELEDFVWIVLLCGLMNVFAKLLRRAGSMDSFAQLITKYAKTDKQVRVFSWLLQWPMFFDDYMTIAVGGSMLAPIYDKKKVPREDCAFIVHSLAEPLRVLFPLTSWTAFMAGLFESGGLTDASGSGAVAFFKTIPFSFYAWVSLIGTLLFCLGIIPKIGPIKRPDPSKYLDLGAEPEGGERQGNLIDFFLPLAGMIVAAMYFEWDLVPTMIVVLPCVCAYYLIRGVISTKDIEGCLIDGFQEFMYLDILFVASYALAGIFETTGFVDYLVSIAQNVVNPALLPVMLFLIFCCSEAAMSLNWSLMLIAFPVVIPLALGIGANVYLTAAAVISAGCFGCHLCYVCDYTSMSGQFCGIQPAHHASTCVPYALIFGGITAVLYLVCGFIF
ncbi:sodium:proton antiporter [Oscillospiraceae bacterium NSJ-64]|uniref:Sodium:proton antiporter n=2 Tax=Youxingia wuxianensis TaxID=2763678 RepID=A0A926ENR7_9FIRM|nr:sodium:proton antiporter [Youxingia wuxianensis]